MKRRSRRRLDWALFAAPALLGSACNAIFDFKDPVHRADEVGGGAGDTGSGGTRTGGNGGTAGKSTSGGSGGASTTGGASTSGASGASTTGGDAGMAGDTSTGGSSGTAGGSTGGRGGNGGSGTTGGSSGSGGDGCSDDPSACLSCAGLDECAGESCCSSPVVDGCTGCEFPEGAMGTTVTSFRLDAFEVTVGRFRNYVDQYTGAPADGEGAHTGMAGSGWQGNWPMPENKTMFLGQLEDCEIVDMLRDAASTWTTTPALNENKPANCMTFYEAFAFCIWDGGFLPTELERTYAAAGGTELRFYPFGRGIITFDDALFGFCESGQSAQCTVENITDVGSFPDGIGRYGQYDLAGSMWEWVLDYQDGDPFPIAAPCNNCANLVLVGREYRQIRGGGWGQEAAEQQVTNRNANDEPNTRWKNVGVRCARPL